MRWSFEGMRVILISSLWKTSIIVCIIEGCHESCGQCLPPPPREGVPSRGLYVLESYGFSLWRTPGWEKSNPKNLEEWVRTLCLEWANHGRGSWPTLDILVKPDNRKWHCILLKENDGQDWMVIILHHDQIHNQESQSLISVLTNRLAFLFQPLGDYECSCSEWKSQLLNHIGFCSDDRRNKFLTFSFQAIFFLSSLQQRTVRISLE